jgi:hypothetical protein
MHSSFECPAKLGYLNERINFLGQKTVETVLTSSSGDEGRNKVALFFYTHLYHLHQQNKVALFSNTYMEPYFHHLINQKHYQFNLMFYEMILTPTYVRRQE